MRHVATSSMLLAMLLLGVLSAPAHAQRWDVQAVGSQVRFDNNATRGSFSLVPRVEYQRGPAYASVTGLVTAFQPSEWAGQGSGTGSLLFAPAGVSSPLRLEFVGVASGTVHSGGFRTGSTRGEVRVHLAGSYAGAWLGGVATTGWTSSGGGLVSGVGPTAGAWGRYGRVRGSTTFTPLRIDGYWFPEWDAQVALTAGPLDLTGYAGWRHGAFGSGIDTESWGGASASFWLNDRVAFTVAGGSYPAEILQGLPSGRYLTAGIRIASHRPAVPRTRRIGRPVYEVHGSSGRLHFHVSHATRVAIVGDWTGWQPIPLRRGPNGSWILDVALDSGVYRFNLVVDGKRWIVPEGVPSVDNGYGGKNGLLIVP
ncbi:MAG: glycogen-binding domain-containing protein [Gemmatimonadetes bacterium]|nr:glycogen-binding domain-containing protein [Gemmatimonadota bacterium]